MTLAPAHVRVPEVDKEDQPGTVPVVDDLVLEAVVDDGPLARLPADGLVAHPDVDLALLGHNQTEVGSEP